MTKPKTPPGTPPGQGGHPPGQGGGEPPDTDAAVGGVVLVVAPGIVDAINKLTSAVVEDDEGQPPTTQPPVSLTELVAALNGISAAITEQTEALKTNTESLDDHRMTLEAQTEAISTHTAALVKNTEGNAEHAEAVKHNTQAISEHAAAVQDNTEAINGNTLALDAVAEGLSRIADGMQPLKATRITMTAAIEPGGSTTEETMPPIQLHPNQKLKATFSFNGTVDGEPVIVAQGGFTGMSAQDPKTEEAEPGDPSKVITKVVAHIYCTQPDSITPGGGGTYEGHPELNGRHMISLPCTATVDNPDTGSTVEKIHEPFEFVAEWIPASQGKATTISMPGLEIEE